MRVTMMAAVVVAALLGAENAPAETPKRPNIIYVMTDD